MTDTLVIAPGDTVTLKSGGPAMTVVGMHAAPHNISELIKQTGQMAMVVWADAGGLVQQSQFYLHTLVKKAEDKKPDPIPVPPAPTARDNSLAARDPQARNREMERPNFTPPGRSSDDDRDQG